MNVINEIGERLGVLASRSAQEMYMAHATLEEYLLPSECIDAAADVAKMLENDGLLARLGANANARTTAAIDRFAIVWRNEFPNADAFLQLPRDKLVREDKSWNNLRCAAQQCLEEIGFDLAAWENENGYAAHFVAWEERSVSQDLK
jgi:hypothetical protein